MPESLFLGELFNKRIPSTDNCWVSPDTYSTTYSPLNSKQGLASEHIGLSQNSHKLTMTRSVQYRILAKIPRLGKQGALWFPELPALKKTPFCESKLRLWWLQPLHPWRQSSPSTLSATSRDPRMTHLGRCVHPREDGTLGCTRSSRTLWCSRTYAGSLRCVPGTRQYLQRRKQTEIRLWNVGYI